MCNLSSTSVAAAARDSLASKLEKTNGVARPMEQLKSPELPDTVTEVSRPFVRLDIILIESYLYAGLLKSSLGSSSLNFCF